MLPTDPQRSSRSVTFGQALGAKEHEPLVLNKPESAVCTRCGAEPRYYAHINAKGCEVAIWIPIEHRCRPMR